MSIFISLAWVRYKQLRHILLSSLWMWIICMAWMLNSLKHIHVQSIRRLSAMVESNIAIFWRLFIPWHGWHLQQQPCHQILLWLLLSPYIYVDTLFLCQTMLFFVFQWTLDVCVCDEHECNILNLAFNHIELVVKRTIAAAVACRQPRQYNNNDEPRDEDDATAADEVKKKRKLWGRKTQYTSIYV